MSLPPSAGVSPLVNMIAGQEYTFESKQYLQIIVLDIDDPRNLPTSYVPNAAETDLLGRVECLLSEIVGARNSTFDKELTGNRPGRKYGRIRVQSEELAEGSRAGDTLVLRMQGKELAAKDGALGGLDQQRGHEPKTCLAPMPRSMHIFPCRRGGGGSFALP